MKRILLISAAFFLLWSFCYAGDVSVKGYYRKDGTYVRPHHRSSPDNDLSNNYGRASSQQTKQYQSLPVIPSYNNDYDNDGTANRYDKDDDNDGVGDNYDSNPYSSRSHSQPSYKSPSQSYSKPFYSHPSSSYGDDSDDNGDSSSYSIFGDSEKDSDSTSDSSSGQYDW